MQKVLYALVFLAGCALPCVAADALLLFDSPGCPHCRTVLAAFAERGPTNHIAVLDLGIPANYQRFITEAARRGETNAWPGSMPVLMAGPAIVRGESAILAGMDGTWQTGTAVSWLPSSLGLRLVVVGLIDGINPCVFALMIFLVATLRLAGRRGRDFTLAAAVFIVAVGSTYLVFGWGLLQGLRLMLGSPAIRGSVYGCAALFCGIAAAWSCRAAWRGEPVAGVPERWRRALQRTMRKNIAFGSSLLLVAAMGVLGAGVESVCTGQVYVPALLALERAHRSAWSAFGLLVLYNLAFIAPLTCVAVAAIRGLRAPGLQAWGTRQARYAQALLGIVFLAFACALGWWASREFVTPKARIAPAPRIMTSTSHATFAHIAEISCSNAVRFVTSMGCALDAMPSLRAGDGDLFWLFDSVQVGVDFWRPRYVDIATNTLVALVDVQDARAAYPELAVALSATNYPEFSCAVAWWFTWQRQHGDPAFKAIPSDGLLDMVDKACSGCGEETGFRLLTSRFGFASKAAAQRLHDIAPTDFPVVVTWRNTSMQHAAVLLGLACTNGMRHVRFPANAPPVIIAGALPVSSSVWRVSVERK